MQSPPPRAGIAYALAAYGAWGLFPAFWKLLSAVPAPVVLANRILWSMAFVSLLVLGWRRWAEARAVLSSRRLVATLFASTLCLSFNWLIFIWAVAQGRVLESSLGYFLNPLVNVLLGVMVLGERLRPVQWLAVGLAVAGVAALTLGTGSAPWLALGMAASFGVYGLLRKRAPVDPLTGLAVETGLLAPMALLFLLWRAQAGEPAFGSTTAETLLLAGGGVVTTLPLVWFAAAAKRLRYVTLGFIQYMAPTGHFLLAVLAYGERVTPWHAVTFGCIWAAIAVYSLESFLKRNG